MPSHQPSLSEFVLSALKEKVVKDFNFPIASKTYCDRLSELIEAQTGRVISVNLIPFAGFLMYRNAHSGASVTLFLPR